MGREVTGTLADPAALVVSSCRWFYVDMSSPMTRSEAACLWDVQPGFLNTASYGPPPRPAWAALQRSLDQWRDGSESWHSWAGSVGTSRALFAAMVGTTAAHVTTGAAVSQLLAPIAAAVPDGGTVLVPDIEFTSGIFPFAVHADRGVVVRTVPVSRLADAINIGTDLVSFSAVQSATGEVADIASISSRAREVGAVTVLDASQAVGWLDLDAGDVDVLTAAAYKWLCAPRGTAFATLHPELSLRHPDFAGRLRPLAAGWFAAEANQYYGMPLRLATDARRFDISPAWHSWVGTAPALEVLSQVGVPAIGKHDVELANSFLTALNEPPSNSAIVSVPVPQAALDRLRAAGIRYAIMDGRARFAFHLYCSSDDVDMAVRAIKG